MKAIIVEDEIPAAERLQKIINDLNRGIDIVAVLDSVKSCIDWFKNNDSPDLVLLDIQLADGPSFEIFKHIRIEAPIIFTTAYDEYALQAFEQNSVDYLLKPITESKLNRSIDRLEQWKHLGKNQLENLLKELTTRELEVHKYKDRFLVKGDNKYISIVEDQIAYFYSVNKIVLLVTHEDRKFAVSQTIEELVPTLNPDKFFRLNRGIIASINSIKSIEPGFNGKLHVKLAPVLKDTVHVSREKAKEFKIWMGE